LGLGDSHSVNTSIAALNSNTWHHIVLTWNQGNYVVYVDGVQRAAGSYSGLTSLNTFADIGNDGNLSYRNEGFNGLIDKVRMYNRALSAGEVSYLFNIDSPFAFAPIGDKTVDEASNLNFTVETANPNINVNLSDHNLPSQPDFTNNTFNWIPTYDDAGRYAATFTAQNGMLEDTETITITVNNVNRSPVIEPIVDKYVDENALLTFSVYASDPDGDNLSYTTENLPDGAVFSNHMFEWVPSNNQAGVYTVTFTATDGDLSDGEDVNITVNDTSVPGQQITIIDNGDPQTSFTSAWYISGGSNPYGTDSFWSRDGSTYTWTFSPATSGCYDLSMWWTTFASRSDNIPVNIEQVGGTSTVYINQLQNAAQWNSLGAYTFHSGQSYDVTIISQPGPSSTCADAVKFELIGQYPDTNIIDGINGFTYKDDSFRNTNQPAYAAGSSSANMLQVLLGGIDKYRIYGMSGGWQQDFTLNSDATVILTVNYNLTQTPEYERDEFSDVLISINGMLIGTSGRDYIARIIGNGNGGSPISTGWQQFETTLNLTAGNYTLVIGAYNNKKNYYNESTELLINKVVLRPQ
jgi:hypothetical protein